MVLFLLPLKKVEILVVLVLLMATILGLSEFQVFVMFKMNLVLVMMVGIQLSLSRPMIMGILRCQELVFGVQVLHGDLKMDGTPVEYYDGIVRPFSPQKNNLKEPFGVGETKVHSLALQGANEKGSFRASFTDSKSSRMEANNNYDRFNASFNSDLNLTDDISVALTFNYAKINNINPRKLGNTDNGWGKALLYNWGRSERVKTSFR